MAHDEETNWLDEAFDDRKAAEELDRAKKSNRLGLVLVIVAVVVIAVLGFGCSGMVGALSALS